MEDFDFEKNFTISSVLEVNFINPKKVTVSFDAQKFGNIDYAKLAHASFFILRQLVNLTTKNAWVINDLMRLETYLEKTVLDAKKVNEIIKELNSFEMEVTDNKKEIIDKQFRSTLNMSEATGINHKTKVSGFGFLGLSGDLNMHVNNSVTALIIYLLKQYVSDETMIKKILMLSYLCASKVAAGQVGLTNQNEIATSFAPVVWLMGEDKE